MKSIIYIGMDVHKKTYSLCALLKETGEIIGETKIPADVRTPRNQLTVMMFRSRQAMKQDALAILFTGS